MLLRPSRMVVIALGLGVLGSGWARPQDPAVEALPGPDPVPALAIGAALPTRPVRRDNAGFNLIYVDTSLQPRDQMPRLAYEGQTGDFALGQKLTGSTSGATATIMNDADNGGAGLLTISRGTRPFRDGEPITDGKQGAATVKGGAIEGIWVLNFAFKPVRVRNVEIKGKGRRDVYYLYYRVVNRTSKPRMFVPQFTLFVPERNQRYPDLVLPESIAFIKAIEAREDASIPLLGAVDVMGMMPVSNKQGIDDAVFGVAMWEVDDTIARADRFSVYVRGLSDGYKRQSGPGGKEVVTYKTLRIDFDRPGDERDLNSREIRLLDPPYEWVYW